MVRSSSLHRQALAFIPPTRGCGRHSRLGRIRRDGSGKRHPDSDGSRPDGGEPSRMRPRRDRSVAGGMDAATVYAIVPEESMRAIGSRRSWRRSARPRRSARRRPSSASLASGRMGCRCPAPASTSTCGRCKATRRGDNYLYQNTLEAETYPLATFVLRRVEGHGRATGRGSRDDPAAHRGSHAA